MNSADEPLKIKVPCPWCGDETTIEPITPDAPLPPPPGAPIICMSCATPMIFAAEGNPRRPLEHEWARLNADDNVTKIRRDIMEQGHKTMTLQSFDVTIRTDE